MHKDNVRTGQRVVVTLKSPRKLHGVVKYIGRINSLPGDLWIGIELNEPHPGMKTMKCLTILKCGYVFKIEAICYF